MRPSRRHAEAVLHDGTTIPLSISGGGPALVLPVRAEPRPEAEAATMRAWGADPDLGPDLVSGLSPTYRVIAADYEGHRMAHPADVAVEPGDWDAATVQTTEAQTRQFVTLYEALQDFDDSTAALAPGLPRLAFAGSADHIDYGPRWGDVQVRIGAPLAEHQRELTAAGWDVQVLPGLDHLGAMQSSVVVPLLKNWLDTVTGT